MITKLGIFIFFMKRFIIILAAAAAVFAACSGLEQDEFGQVDVKSDVSAVQTIVKALESNGSVKTVKSGSDNSFSIVLRSNAKINVRVPSGSYAPSIGAVKGDDGEYYWALNGDALSHSVTGVIPDIKIEDGKVLVSFDGSNTWSEAGRASESGALSLFKSVADNDDDVTFGMGDGSELVLPKKCPLRMVYDAELPLAVDPNSSYDLGYRIESAIQDVTVDLAPSKTIKAEIVENDGLAGKIRIEAGNIIDEDCQIKVSLSDGTNRVVEYIKFLPAEGEVFELISKEINLFDTSGEFNVKLYANLGYEVAELPAWIESVKSEAGDQPRLMIHTFNVQENGDAVSRSGNIVLCSESQARLTVPVNQMGKADAEKPFYHRSVAVRYTADWCGYCPNMATGFDAAAELMPGRLEVISMHCDGALIFQQSQLLMNQFYVTGFPMGIIDGRMLMQNYDIETISSYTKKYAEQTAELYSTASGIAMTSSLDGRDLNLNITAYLKNADSYKITIFLVEDGIVGYQANYTTGSTNNYVHNGVVRQGVGDVLGVSFRTDSDKEIREFSYSARIEEKYDVSNMRAVVYIQRAFGDREKVQSQNYGDYYIDNCVSAKFGEEVELKFAE